MRQKAIGLALALLLASALSADAQFAGPTGGATPFHYLSGASTNSTLVKGSVGNVYSIVAINQTATVYFLKFYDKAVAPTCATDTVVQTYPLPASATIPTPVVVSLPVGMQFLNGIGFCITGAIADSDNTNAAANVVVNLSYR
jgi:hypothetical protein